MSFYLVVLRLTAVGARWKEPLTKFLWRKSGSRPSPVAIMVEMVREVARMLFPH